MGVAAEIRTALEQAFTVHDIEIIDESEAHRGHSGYREGGESHFRVRLRAPELAQKSRLERHRAVHAALGPDLLGRLHALALDLDG
ncbi:BolA family protein [Roseovarius salinarum]|uniref:BolA family protein n=1 Tax=Roseovarius salinarum TaxID=1981892 RepID=UPI000C34AB50|nr:BolA family protein [Roseovarius salinarum]